MIPAHISGVAWITKWDARHTHNILSMVGSTRLTVHRLNTTTRTSLKMRGHKMKYKPKSHNLTLKHGTMTYSGYVAHEIYSSGAVTPVLLSIPHNANPSNHQVPVREGGRYVFAMPGNGDYRKNERGEYVLVQRHR